MRIEDSQLKSLAGALKWVFRCLGYNGPHFSATYRECMSIVVTQKNVQRYHICKNETGQILSRKLFLILQEVLSEQKIVRPKQTYQQKHSLNRP
jgi:hypothetical protein